MRKWKLVLPVAIVATVASVVVGTSLAASQANEIRVAVLTDCKGPFGGAYEITIGGAMTAFAQWANGKPKNPAKPSAGMTGIKAGGKDIKIVGIGCGDDTAATALKETRRLMEQLKADVMVGPLSGDEAVAVANYARTKPTKTFIIGTAGSQDPTLQIAPKNVFRYHGDGAQWNAGLGEIVYKKLGWRNAAIIMDDYSFGWTSGAGIIADFCAIGGKITKRVFPPLGTTDYSSFVQQLPSPDSVDGYFWVVGGTGTGAALKAFSQTYGTPKASQHAGNLFFAFLGNFEEVAPNLIGSYVGGFGTGPGVKTPQSRAYEAIIAKHYGPAKLPAADGFVYNYYNAAWALVAGLNKAGGDLAKLQASMPRQLRSGYEISDRGNVKLDSNRQAIQDQYPLRIVRTGDQPGLSTIGYVPNVDQSFGGLFRKASPPPGRTQPPCVKKSLPWQGKIRAVVNGRVTNQVIK